jgi:hypothetical protein
MILTHGARAPLYHSHDGALIAERLENRRRARPSAARETFAPLAKPPSPARRVLVALTMAASAAALMAVVAAREKIAAAAPFIEPAYAAIGLPVNTRGLAIEDVRARIGDISGKRFLVVEGSIVNLRDVETAPPDLRISLRGGDGRELYVWTARAGSSHLGAGARAPFAARLETPPDGVKDAMVKFIAAAQKPGRGKEAS